MKDFVPHPAKALYNLEYFKIIFQISLLFFGFWHWYFAQNKFAMSSHFSEKESFPRRVSEINQKATFENYALYIKNRKFLSFDVYF